MESQNSPKLAFYYSLVLVTLIIGSVSLGTMFFEFVNKFFPLIQNDYYGELSGLKFAISGVIISFPIFYFMSFLIYKGITKGDFIINSPVRKWLTYFIIFVSAVVMIGSLITLLNNFLDGETTFNFVLKAISVLVISSAIFSFYFCDIKSKALNNKFNMTYFITSLIIVCVALISSFFIIETPSQARDRKIDEKILGNFETISRGLEQYYYENKKLPQNLDELKNQNYNYINSNEFIEESTGKYYAYNIVDEKKYELCATFNSSSINSNNDTSYYSTIWKHDKGYQCITKRIENIGGKY
ncbi:MAG: DUF5671 domain-containing protein [Candidatus Pacebacteria bacterium]|nr:DUF5671 domain-containing protein [Candidatus Paceibacterota bacterium]